MSKKYKTWGEYRGQTVLARSVNRQGRPGHVLIRCECERITVHRNEIPSLIAALLEVGDLK